MFNNSKQPTEPFAFSTKDRVYTILKFRGAKKFVKGIFGFLHGSKDNLAFLKVDSKEINYVVMPIEVFDRYQEIDRELKRHQDDVFIMSQILKEMKKEENS